MAALSALMIPATAGAAVHADASAKKKKKAKPPVVTRVTPLRVEIGQKLEIRGRYFLRGRNKNTVVFKRSGGKAVFVKADVGTTKLLRLTVPAKLQKEFTTRGTELQPTLFRIRVLAKKFGKKYTTAARSPLVFLHSTPPPPGFVASQPEGDCDGDGMKNKVDSDDDNDGLTDDVEQSLNLNPCVGDTDGDGVSDKWEFDCDRNGVLNRDESDDDKDLLTDGQEQAIGTDPCNADSDGDGVSDGYEYQSARDLNDDEDQQPNDYLPYPGARPYPNPLFSDANVDYDGDSLTLGEEFTLWKYVGNMTLSPLSYSDGEQYSVFSRGPGGRRVPTLVRATYDKRTQFLNWASAAGYRNVMLQDGAPWHSGGTVLKSYDLLDVNRDDLPPSTSELYYNDLDGNGVLSDDERDEDADGLSNYDETHGRMFEKYWTVCYSSEKVFHVGYTGTSVTNPDTDGDGVRDGADDTDHDDVPNMDELSRFAASGLDDRKTQDCQPKEGLGGGNFSVSGGPLPGAAVVVTFENKLGNVDVAQMTASGADLTGGSSPAVIVTTTRPGGGGVDEQQTVTITGGPTGGVFTLTLAGKTTSLAYNSNAATVEAALKKLVPGDSNHPNVFGRVNPFNPCMPFRYSRTCPHFVNGDTGAPFDGSPDWYSLQ